MNNKIKEIIETNLGTGFDYETKEFKRFLIEICEFQKQSIVNDLDNINFASAYHVSNYSQNIAE